METVKTTMPKCYRRRVRGANPAHHCWGVLLIHCLQLAHDSIIAFCYVDEELIIVAEVEVFHVKPDWGKAHLPPAHRGAELFCTGHESFGEDLWVKQKALFLLRMRSGVG